MITPGMITPGMITLTLDDGRALGVVPVEPHEAMTIAEGCRDLSGIRAWWRMALAASAIRSIDGIPMPMPTHERHIEGLIARFSRQDMKRIIEVAEQPMSQPAPELELVELTALETLRIWAVIGTFETIAAWVAPAFIAGQVRAIDGERLIFPSSKQEMKEIVRRLGLAGMEKASAFLLAKQESDKVESAGRQAAAKN